MRLKLSPRAASSIAKSTAFIESYDLPFVNGILFPQDSEIPAIIPMAHVKEDRVAVRDLKLDFYLGPTSPDRPGRRVPMPFTMLDGYQGEATHGFILRHPENYRELNPSFSRILGNENAKGMDIKGPCVIVLCNQRGIFVNATYEDIRYVCAATTWALLLCYARTLTEYSFELLRLGCESEETDREDIASESDKEGGEI